MQIQNYQSLLQQLKKLISDQQVQQNVDQQLNLRALKLLKCKANQQKINSSTNILAEKNILKVKKMDQTKPISKQKQTNGTQSKKKLNALNYIVTNSKSDLVNKSNGKYKVKQILDNSMQNKQNTITSKKEGIRKNAFSNANKIERQRSISGSKERLGSKVKKIIVKTEPSQNFMCKNGFQQYSQYKLDQDSNFPFQSQSQSAQLEIVKLIQQKQVAARQQKRCLENRAAELRQFIEQQKCRIAQINSRNIIMQSQLSRIEQNNQASHTTFHVDRKKLETLFSDVKMVHQSLIETKQQNQQVVRSLQEERDLINMYKTVIEQLKSQMKIQREQYDSIKKGLTILKKNEQVAKMKYLSASGSSNGILDNLKDSINRWRT